MKATNLKELAQILNLSPSTVSKALKNKPDIGHETKLRVKELAKEYNYIPNAMAQNFKTGKTKSIGVILPNVVDEFFGMVLQGIEKEASKNNYKVVICISDDKNKKEELNIEALINGSVDGILISLAKETQAKQNFDGLNRIIDHGITVVQLDRVFEQVECDKVCVDDFDGAYKATKYLIETGCKNIAFLSTISGTSVVQMRKEGYKQALKLESQNSPNPIFIEIKKYENFQKTIHRILEKNAIDSILAADELSAIHTISSVETFGMKVPDDVSIVGFTNGAFAKCSNPSLTTVSQHAAQIGIKAAKKLIERIKMPKKDTPYQNVIIKTDLTVRNSTK